MFTIYQPRYNDYCLTRNTYGVAYHGPDINGEPELKPGGGTLSSVMSIECDRQLFEQPGLQPAG